MTSTPRTIAKTNNAISAQQTASASSSLIDGWEALTAEPAEVAAAAAAIAAALA